MLGLVKSASRSISRNLRSFSTLPFQTSTLSPSKSKTRITTLKNGIKVATEDTGVETATVGVWIDAGSRRETPKNNGTAHFLEHMAFKGTGKRTMTGLELEIENMGGHLNAYTSREHTAYYAKVFRKDIGQAIDILSDILQNAKYDNGAIEKERQVILREHEEVNKQMEEVVFDHLHAAAYQGTSLGLTILGTPQNIKSITRENLVDFVKKNYVGCNMVIAAAGGVDHDELVKLTEKTFGSIPKGINMPYERALFTGSELRMRDDTMANAHMIIAVEGASWSSPDYFPLLVGQSVIGSWDRSMSGGVNLSSEWAQYVSKKNMAQSYSAFHTSYKDTGLFGLYLVSDRRYELDNLCCDMQQQWVHCCCRVTEEEVERAKTFLKISFLSQLDGTTPLCEDIGRQVLCYGKRLHLDEIFAEIDQVDFKKVRDVMTEYWYDKCPAVVGFGCVETMSDYLDIRQHMLWVKN